MNLTQRIKSLFDVISKLKYILNQKQKLLGYLVIFMTIINAALQTLGVTIIVPLVGAMTSPELTMDNKYVILVCHVFNIEDSIGFFLIVAIATIVLYIIKDAFSVIQLWVCTKYSFMVQRELATSVLETYMHRPYDFFLNYGTSKVIRDVQKDSYGVNCILAAIFALVTEFLTMFFITIYIVAMDWKMAICIACVACVCILIIYKYFKNKMREAGEQSRILSAESQKILLESVEGIKEVQVMCKQDFFIEEFKKAYYKEQRPNMTQRFVTESPTHVIEGIFIAGLMTFVTIRMVLDPGYAKTMPILASFLMGAVRMLPSLGRVSSRLNGLSFDMPSLYSVYKNIKGFKETNNKHHCQIDSKKNISFERKLCLKDVCWKYEGAEKEVLHNFHLMITKGKSVGIIGQSGAGKSTFADIVLGLHIPQKGTVELDGVSISDIPFEYSRVVGYVPQTVYLVDGSIRENVAFGERNEDIDDDLVWKSLRQAKLDAFVSESEQGLDTIVGERGVRFSGGQRQRLAIARALYRKPQILVLDEATSALDNETEAAVMDAIEGLYGSITMIIIAHRLTTVKKCDEIYEITNGTAVLKDKGELFS